jgi:hypothetical protein
VKSDNGKSSQRAAGLEGVQPGSHFFAPGNIGK